MNGRVAGYRDLVESLARKFVGRNQAEYDDLVQEGLINVWQTLERGVTPSAALIEARMLDWVRLLGSQTGRGRKRNGDPIEYAELLPFERIVGVDEGGEALTLGETLTLDAIPLPGHDPLA
jgi:DNA-directed RNA polymerase specialized sigma24 family protein